MGILEPYVDVGQHKECFVLVVDRGFETLETYLAGSNAIPDPPEEVAENIQTCITKLLKLGFAYVHLTVCFLSARPFLFPLLKHLQLRFPRFSGRLPAS